MSASYGYGTIADLADNHIAVGVDGSPGDGHPGDRRLDNNDVDQHNMCGSVDVFTIVTVVATFAFILFCPGSVQKPPFTITYAHTPH